MYVLQKNYLSFIVKNMKKNDVFYKKISKIYDVYTKPHKYAVKFLESLYKKELSYGMLSKFDYNRKMKELKTVGVICI